jgi:hypothetical protein
MPYLCNAEVAAICTIIPRSSTANEEDFPELTGWQMKKARAGKAQAFLLSYTNYRPGAGRDPC